MDVYQEHELGYTFSKITTIKVYCQHCHNSFQMDGGEGQAVGFKC